MDYRTIGYNGDAVYPWHLGFRDPCIYFTCLWNNPNIMCIKSDAVNMMVIACSLNIHSWFVDFYLTLDRKRKSKWCFCESIRNIKYMIISGYQSTLFIELNAALLNSEMPKIYTNASRPLDGLYKK